MPSRVVERLPPSLRRAAEPGATAFRAIIDTRLPGLAAEIAFWVLLSLPALLVAGVAAAGIATERVVGSDWQEVVIDRVSEVGTVALTPGTIERFVEPALRQLLEGGGASVLSFAFLAAIWTASRAVKTVLSTLAIVSGRSEVRTGWQDRLIGFAVTLVGMIVGILLAPVLIAGPRAGQLLQDATSLDLALLARLWEIGYWPTVVLTATLVLATLYHFGIPGRTRWHWELPGAVLASAVWLLGSAGLRLYGSWVLNAEGAYGPLAGPIVGLLWLWVTGFAVLLGGLLNTRLVLPRVSAPADGTRGRPRRPDRDQSASGTSKENTVPSSSRLTTPN